MVETKVLMEKFKGFEIFYDKEKERFVCDKELLDIHFEARTLWEIKEMIKETQVKEVNKTVYKKSGYDSSTLAKIHILTMNPSNNHCKYKVLEDTNDSYDVGKIEEDTDIPVTYEITDHNTKIYLELTRLNKQIVDLVSQQKSLVKKVK